jgi:RNA-binding motif protein, X-linked 2
MNIVREVQKINEEELRRGIDGSSSASWHATYSNSAWIYVGGLDIVLTEGDVLCVLSQYGEIEEIDMIRDEVTGKSKGFCFLKYEDARSAILAVDNMNGITLLGKTLRIDHKLEYKRPKKNKNNMNKNDGNDNDDNYKEEKEEEEKSGRQLSSQDGIDVFGQIRKEQIKGKKVEEKEEEKEEEDIKQERKEKKEDILLKSRQDDIESKKRSSVIAFGTSGSSSSTSTFLTRTGFQSAPTSTSSSSSSSSTSNKHTKIHKGHPTTSSTTGGVTDWRGRYASGSNGGRR